MPDYDSRPEEAADHISSAVAAQRMPGETFASFAARQKASWKMQKPGRKTGKVVRQRKTSEETFETKLDDLGESPE